MSTFIHEDRHTMAHPLTGPSDERVTPPINARMHRIMRWEDTIPTEPGSADALGDDVAERHSSWGALSECAAEGGKHREPSATIRDEAPSALGWLLWPLVAVAAIASAAALWP